MRSFPLLPASGLVPRPQAGKQALAAIAAALLLPLSACGGESEAVPQAVQGTEFTLMVPAHWEAQAGPRRVRAAPAEEATERVEVVTFRLARAYRPELWPEVVGELDGVAAELARQLDPAASAPSGRTRVIAARRARVYDISYERDDQRRIERVAFVLSGRREYQLLCRWDADDPGEGEEACDLLFSSFRLA